jgi:putative FmdB family regulatory protein
MPTYTYKCEKCEKTFDKFQSMTEEPLKICIDENCKGNVRRLIGTGAGAILKGSGFYQTDFKNSGKKEEKKAECKSCPSASSCEKAS